jgi:predicted RecA/RadA family phage recombinase
MASLINAVTTGVGGFVTTGDNSGNLNLQCSGNTVIAVTPAGANVTGEFSIFAGTGSTERMRLDSSGNLGLGVTPSAWGSSFGAIQVGAGSALWGETGLPTGTYLSSNLYYNGTNRIYIGGTYKPAEYSLYNGIHTWLSAAAGTAGTTITLTPLMTLDASGQLAIGRTTAAAMLDIEKGGATTNATSGILTLRTSTSGTAAAGLGSYINFLTENSNGTQYETAYIGVATESSTAADKDGYIFFSTALNSANPAERMRIDASGNVGIGVTPSTWTSQTALQVGGGATGASLVSGTIGVVLASNLIYNSGWKYLGNGYLSYYQQSAGRHYWGNAPSGTAGNAATVTDRMTLDTSGNLLLSGLTSQIYSGRLCIADNLTVFNPIVLKDTQNSSFSSIAYAVFLNAGNVEAGKITHNGSTTVQYITSSDYRLKENIASMTGALEKVALLKPVTYTWKDSGSDGQGFIAHELQEVVPDCVDGEKDAVNEDGSIKAQGIDTSFLVATLTAAIQELKAIVDTQAEQIKALQGVK